MEREIKFRGRDKDGKWVYGDLRHENDKVYIYTDDLEDWRSRVPVDTDTIGQYTNLKDRNGKEIYESDIVKFHFEHHKFGNVFEDIIVIRWNERCMQWQYDNLTNEDTSIFELAENQGIIEQSNGRCWFEVIGNIYDNPEMLEED